MYHIKEDKRTQVTVRLISEALVHLILNKKWEQVSITLLANKAGVGRASFYRSFDALEDVLQYQVDKAIEELFRTMFEELHQRPFFYEKDIYDFFFRFWTRYELLLKTLIFSKQKELFNRQFSTLYGEKLYFIKNLLQISDEHWPYFVTLRSTMLSSGLFEWVQKNKKESPEEISSIMLLSFSELHSAKMSKDYIIVHVES